MSIMGTESPAKLGFEAIPRNKVYQEVAKQLERHITEELKPGDLLPSERQLVQMLGVSRSSVRDAIRSLELKGLLSHARVSARWFAIPMLPQPVRWLPRSWRSGRWLRSCWTCAI